ncbi:MULTISPECIES: IS66 family insertion sequence element accessory protein TnpA [Corallococcus]|uniref:IS66 family insertion sequence element accessory protein TnpA n=1 Tax=Corallococcus TaxID=83461 RepID=UPI001F420B60|nr:MULTISPECIES: hypothetical protein [Corallococcus]
MSKQVEKPEWARIAEAFEASGQTQREFALARGVRLSTLQSWVYRRRRAGEARAEPVRLLPVQVATAPAASESVLEVVANGNRPASDVPGRLKTGPDCARRAPRGVSCSGTGLEG